MLPAATENAMPYEKFDIRRDASLGLNYLTSMVDARFDHLPYWLIGANENPAWAKHCRVDDAELVASWYEALVATQELLGTTEGSDVLAGFKRHLLKSWGEHGLRFHEPYPWSNTLHSSFHEMAYILGALNRWRVHEPDNREVIGRMESLVRGMRELVHHRKTKTFWSGDYPYDEPIYEFPNDIWIKGHGWDFSRVTGRGEEAVRNGMMLHSLVKTYQLFGDEIALDLATGMANHLLGPSRYFNYDGEFFGHVHSAVWVAAGLVLLGRLRGNDFYVKKGRQIYEYVLRISTSFGWVPEFAQWHPPTERFCETCCIKDMIWCGLELIDAGHWQYWDVINRFVRNQLTENQIKDTSFIGVDNSLSDTIDTTFKDIDKRVLGGWSGGSEPSSISLKRFRSIAGCCIGTAPQALQSVWDNIVRSDGNTTTVNLPIDRDHPLVKVQTGYPNEGWLQATAKTDGDYAIRILPFMEPGAILTVNSQRLAMWVQDGCVLARGVRKGSVLRLEHDIRNETRKEIARGREVEVIWRGSDVVDIAPHGEPLRLYQRIAGAPKEIPSPPPRAGGSTHQQWVAAPTEQKR
jgi:hypothetical protein